MAKNLGSPSLKLAVVDPLSCLMRHQSGGGGGGRRRRELGCEENDGDVGAVCEGLVVRIYASDCGCGEGAAYV